MLLLIITSFFALAVICSVRMENDRVIGIMSTEDVCLETNVGCQLLQKM